MTASQKLLWGILPFLAQQRWEKATSEILAFLRRGEDWNELVLEAGRHRLLGYLAEFLRRSDRSPEPAVAWARQIFEQSRARSTLQAEQRDQVFQLLSDLPHCFLKGSVLAELHEFPYARIVGDVDLLVPPRVLVSSLERLISSGYSLQEPHPFEWPPPTWMRARPGELKFDEISLVQRGMLLEIHTNLISHKLPHFLDVEELFRDRKNSLTPEIGWIHLLINHHMHRFSGGLGSLLDVSLWERKKQPDLVEIRRTLERWQVGYLVDPPLSHLASAFPDLPSVLEWRPPPADPEAILSAPVKVYGRKVTPWHWIRQAPKPLAALRRNLLLSQTEAALRYRRDPTDPMLYFFRAFRPLELLVRHTDPF